MVDLIQAYFERDLTEAEAGELESLLKNSSEDASRFADLSEKAYQATGLLPHEWSGKPLSIPRIGGMGSGWKLWLALGVTGLGALIWHWNTQPSSIVSIPQSVPTDLKVQSLSVPKPKVAAEKTQPLPDTRQLVGDKLSVLVETEQSSLVTVRILDAQGREVRALYAGVLDPGKRVFQWDGLLADGKPALNGSYQIQVQNGARLLSKTVSVDRE